MSRIGKKILEILQVLLLQLQKTIPVTVKGPKGELTRTFNADMLIKIEENTLTVERPSEQKEHRALHGTTRSFNRKHG